MRSLQGLLFLGLALFTLKWSHHEMPVADVRVVLDTVPPLKQWMLNLHAGAFALVGLYLLVTGEIPRLGRRCARPQRTFLAALAFFLAIFAAKWAYHVSAYDNGPRGYYAPLDEESLGLIWAGLLLLGLYFLVRGELDYWRAPAAAGA
ncbi:MAG: hypothetical protein ACYTKD_19380 [Planctomycetota bacterium]|jgi:hypothetical protein